MKFDAATAMITITVHCVRPPNAPIDCGSVEKPPVPSVLSEWAKAWNAFIVSAGAEPRPAAASATNAATVSAT